MPHITYERVLGTYFWFGMAVALLVSPSFDLRATLDHNLGFLPFLSLTDSVPGSMSSCATFFFVMTLALPIAVYMLSKHPQPSMMQVPATGRRAVAATIVFPLMVCLLVLAAYLELDAPSLKSKKDAVSSGWLTSAWGSALSEVHSCLVA